MSPKTEPGLDDSVRVNQNNFPMCLTLNECAQSYHDHEKFDAAARKSILCFPYTLALSNVFQGRQI